MWAGGRLRSSWSSWAGGSCSPVSGPFCPCPALSRFCEAWEPRGPSSSSCFCFSFFYFCFSFWFSSSSSFSTPVSVFPSDPPSYSVSAPFLTDPLHPRLMLFLLLASAAAPPPPPTPHRVLFLHSYSYSSSSSCLK